MKSSNIDFIQNHIFSQSPEKTEAKFKNDLFHLSEKKNSKNKDSNFNSESKSSVSSSGKKMIEKIEKEEINEEHKKVEKIEQTGILSRYSKSFLIMLFDYFDPFTLENLGKTCQFLQEVTMHPHLYKKFCVVLYQNRIPVPLETSFDLLKKYIVSNPLEFQESVRLMAAKDIRGLVWEDENYLETYKTHMSFYKQFADWRNFYLHAPRICLKGYYVLKEKYLKTGEKDFNQTYNPVHIVEYFRFLRFFDDGKCVMAITVSKLPREKLAQLLVKNKQNLENEVEIDLDKKKFQHLKATVLYGEYIRKEGRVFIRFCQNSSSVFHYQLMIKSSEIGKNDLLILEKKEYRELTTNFLKDDNDIRAESLKIFEFKEVEEFEKDIADSKLRTITR